MIVDAVVAWVDGSDPAHAHKLDMWLKRVQPNIVLGAGATSPLRFQNHSEIVYCLRSIRTHAPWVRTIWLVTDDQFPAEFDRTAAEQHGIRVVDHRHIFREFEEHLPTFNSGAIESLLWRIDGLAEHFLYFNDDMFLAGRAVPRDFYKKDRVILRGYRTDWSIKEPTAPYFTAQLNAAKVLGEDPAHLFIPGHAPHALRRSVMEMLFERHPDVFRYNASLRFRTNTRVHPIALHNFSLMQQGRAIIRSRKRLVYLGAAPCKRLDANTLADQLDKVERPHMLSFCINDFGALARKLPDLHARMKRIVGPAGAWEFEHATDPVW